MNKFKFIVLSVLLASILIPNVSLAASCLPNTQTSPGDSNANSLCNPAEAVAGTKISTFLINVLRVFSGVAGIVTIVYVVFSAFKFLLSQGDSEKVESAKKSLQWSISGFVVVMLSFVLVSALRLFLEVQPTPESSTAENPIVYNPLAANNFNELYLTFIIGFFQVLGLLAILFIVINGFRYITARGDEEQVAQAKKGLQYSVLSILLAAMAYVIVQAVATFFK